ncbi:hypothetical protein JHK87_049788 [Glycine soja]|nr:hypothetical protein JHK87_049788 [Glycine soja]
MPNFNFEPCCALETPLVHTVGEAPRAVKQLLFSFFGSLSNVGAMVGAIASGQIAECIGREGSLMIAAIPNIIGWLAISFAKDSSFLYMGRLLEGFGVGIISYVVLVYIAEIAPQNLRGGLGSVNQVEALLLLLDAKMGMIDEFETSLQVLRGFDTDISFEVHEIKISRGKDWVLSRNYMNWVKRLELKAVVLPKNVSPPYSVKVQMWVLLEEEVTR